jgi:hypothetical protein
MTQLKVIDFQTEEKFWLPKEGEGNWAEWLAEQGYIVCDRIPVGQLTLELYASSDGSPYAVYHPPFQGLDTECLFVSIPSEKQSQELVSLAQQMLGMMNLMMNLKSPA